MKIIKGVINNNLEINSLTVIKGTVNGTVSIASSASLILKGAVNGLINVEKNARLEVLGSVNGEIRNKGHIQVYGFVEKVVSLGGQLDILDEGIVNEIN